MFRRFTVPLVLACTLASCTPARHQTLAIAPTMSAELQQAFQGPLCRRLDGIDWPCSDTDGSMWRAWYIQRQARGALGMGMDRPYQTTDAIALPVSEPVSVTTRCYVGRYFSRCTSTSY